MSKKETIYFKRSKYRKEDFSLSDLPDNRGKQFFDIFKNDWKTLLLSGLILLIFSLPFLTLEFFHRFVSINLPFSRVPADFRLRMKYTEIFIK